MGETREQALKRLQATRALVLPSPRSGTAITAHTKNVDELQKASGTEGWRLHDIRRSFVSHLAEAGHDETVCDMILNHAASSTRAGVLGTYQRSSRWPAQVAAMKSWGELLAKFTGQPIPHEPETSNVVALRA